MAEGDNVSNTQMIENFLSDLRYPADKRGIIMQAKEKSIHEDDIFFLQQMPDRIYDSFEDIRSELRNVK
jgi:hypothetical protein